MRWLALLVLMVVTEAVEPVGAGGPRGPGRSRDPVAPGGPRRCAGRLARERLKAAEKIRDKRYYLLCCAPNCGQQRRPRPPPTTKRYQPFHKTWYGLKHGTAYFRLIYKLHFHRF